MLCPYIYDDCHCHWNESVASLEACVYVIYLFMFNIFKFAIAHLVKSYRLSIIFINFVLFFERRKNQLNNKRIFGLLVDDGDVGLNESANTGRCRLCHCGIFFFIYFYLFWENFSVNNTANSMACNLDWVSDRAKQIPSWGIILVCVALAEHFFQNIIFEKEDLLIGLLVELVLFWRLNCLDSFRKNRFELNFCLKKLLLSEKRYSLLT